VLGLGHHNLTEEETLMVHPGATPTPRGRLLLRAGDDEVQDRRAVAEGTVSPGKRPITTRAWGVRLKPMAGAVGFEPTVADPKSAALPLGHAPVLEPPSV
jgi:hypothetical protein